MPRPPNPRSLGSHSFRVHSRRGSTPWQISHPRNRPRRRSHRSLSKRSAPRRRRRPPASRATSSAQRAVSRAAGGVRCVACDVRSAVRCAVLSVRCVACGAWRAQWGSVARVVYRARRAGSSPRCAARRISTCGGRCAACAPRCVACAASDVRPAARTPPPRIARVTGEISLPLSASGPLQTCHAHPFYPSWRGTCGLAEV